MARSRQHDIGNGDPCPINPGHGHMAVLRGDQRQWCPHVDHDGKWSKDGHEPPTRALWPFGHRSFAAAVEAYHSTTAGRAVLPDLDITLEV